MPVLDRLRQGFSAEGSEGLGGGVYRRFLTVRLAEAQTGSNLLRERENTRGDNPWDDYSTESTPKKRKFPGYNQYGGQFRRWCDLMRVDGRGDEVWIFSLSFVDDDPECPACKPFFKTLAASCKEKKKRVRSARGGEPQATPTPLAREREPHIAVVRAIAETVAALAEESRAAETYSAVKKLHAFLAQSEGKTKAASDYYGVLAPYVIAPFRSFERVSAGDARRNGELGASHEGSRKQELDSLFER